MIRPRTIPSPIMAKGIISCDVIVNGSLVIVFLNNEPSLCKAIKQYYNVNSN
jgi:hypothetical protein